jgi:type II secretory ATPase GspE/PulE/Tfp pilus assembly ATPase PilB-like protein
LNSPRQHGRLVYESRPSDSTAPDITAVNHILMGMTLDVLEPRSLKNGRNGLHCRQTGYSGRDVREAAIEKVLNGTTTVSEMVRVTGK